MINDETVMLGHGSGGSMMKRIIDEVFLDAYGSDELAQGDDAAVLSLDAICGGNGGKVDAGVGGTTSGIASGKANGNAKAEAAGEADAAVGAGQHPAQSIADCNTPRIAYSTDSFVVTPHFFPGGDIGRLAVCGTVNDVATSGAVPKWISCGMILEEGFPMDDLMRICKSIREAADEAGVKVVTGDTKVVNRGNGDGIYINTSGIGVLAPNINLSGRNCRPGDKVLLTGTLGDHGITIMTCRENLDIRVDIESDAAPLNHLIAGVLQACPGAVRCFRDPTRGGLASTLNELAAQSNVDITVNESDVPVKQQVIGACEMLGYDVMQVANEGKMVCVVDPDYADEALNAMRANKYGCDAAIIGEVAEVENIERGPKVFLSTAFGSRRILDMLVGEQLPRIC